MGSDLPGRQPSCFHGFMASPSWFPLHKDHHSRFHLLGHEASSADGGRSGRWRNLLRRLKKEGKGASYGSKPLTFHYDIVSYSKNFDDGSCWERESCFCRRCEDSVPRLKPIPAVGPLHSSLCTARARMKETKVDVMDVESF